MPHDVSSPRSSRTWYMCTSLTTSIKSFTNWLSPSRTPPGYEMACPGKSLPKWIVRFGLSGLISASLLGDSHYDKSDILINL